MFLYKIVFISLTVHPLSESTYKSFAFEKIYLRMCINTAGHLGFRLVLPGCRASSTVFCRCLVAVQDQPKPQIPGSINTHAALILQQKVTKSTAGHLFLHTLPTQHLFVIARLLKSTARHLFLSTLATRHLFCSKKISHMCIIATAGLRGFVGLSLLAARHADTTFIITVNNGQNFISSAPKMLDF